MDVRHNRNKILLILDSSYRVNSVCYILSHFSPRLQIRQIGALQEIMYMACNFTCMSEDSPGPVFHLYTGTVQMA